MISIDFIIGRLLNEEAHQADSLSLPSTVDTPSATFAAHTMRDKLHITCYKCRKLGHFQNECTEPDAPDTTPNIAQTYPF
jgi:hypothetical protein